MPRSIFERSGNIVILQIRIIIEDLRPCRAAGQQIEDVGDADTLAANAGAAAANFRIRGNAIKLATHIERSFGCYTRQT